MDNSKAGQETYVTWADFLSPIGCFVLQDGVAWFIIVEICDETMAKMWRKPVEMQGFFACMLFFFGVFVFLFLFLLFCVICSCF